LPTRRGPQDKGNFQPAEGHYAEGETELRQELQPIGMEDGTGNWHWCTDSILETPDDQRPTNNSNDIQTNNPDATAIWISDMMAACDVCGRATDTVALQVMLIASRAGTKEIRSVLVPGGTRHDQ
jgi:hypothetical protein